jgi:pimeloyl-ACP methyl ester carboxylesterase
MLLYVHGVGASEQSFQWLREQLPLPGARFFNYSIDDSLDESMSRLREMIDAGGPTILLGHSLGGVMCSACTHHPNVQKLITLNAPFGGIRYASLLSLFSSLPLLRDLNYYGGFLSTIRKVKIIKPHLAVVGTSGLPFFNESNDGVLTLSSQTAMPDIVYEKLPLNHFEVLLSREVADLIRKFIHDPPISGA